MTTPPRTCLVTDAARYGRERTLEVIDLAARAGADAVQIREKQWPARPLLELVEAAITLARPAGMRVLVNGRLDVALVARADGVHLGGHSLHPEGARELARRMGRGDDFLVGVSVHSRAESARASAGGADYIFFGPVYSTPSKAAYGNPQGVERLAEICADRWTPVLAIGGITAGRVPEVLGAGAYGTACIREVFESDDPAARLEQWVAAHAARTDGE